MRKLLAFCAIVVAIGCSDTTAPAGSVAGVWTLKTVNGFPVPFAAPQGGADTIELTSDVITANASGTFTQLTVMKRTTSGVVTIDSIPDAGNYAISGNVVTFDFSSSSPTGQGVLVGDTLTVTTDITLVYRRQI
jgi:hypothetical protein